LSIDVLAEHGFNMGSAMGTALLGERRPSSLPMIRDLLTVILPVATVVHDEPFWILWHRRHVIVHQRGILDRTYVDRTSDRQVVGTELVLSGADIDAAAVLVRDAAFQIARQCV
jgi:hypothetical protein